MGPLSLISFSYWTLFVLIHRAFAIVLQDIPPSALQPRGIYGRNTVMSALDLRSTESFLWGGPSNGSLTVGNLTVYAPHEDENLLSMERFNGMLSSIACSNTTVNMTFKDDDAFAYAQRTWDWVNGADNHSFVMIASTGDCGWNTHRQPFLVSNLTYDELSNKAFLNATVQSWEEAIHTYELDVGSLMPPEASSSTKARRATDKQLTIPFDFPLPLSQWVFPIDKDSSVIFECDNCGTHGSFAFNFHMETFLFIPTKAQITLSPRSVFATVSPQISFSANFTSTKNFEYAFPPISLDGISIPGGIIELGPELVMSIGIQAGGLRGSATAGASVAASLNDDAQVTVNLLKPGVSKTGNWEPSYTTKPFMLSAQLSTTLKAYEKNSIQLAAKAFGMGFSAGLNLSPYVSATFAEIISTQPVCSNDQHLTGVKIAPAYGVEVRASVVMTTIKSTPLVDVQLWGLEYPLPGLCYGFGLTMTNNTSPASSGTSLGKNTTATTLSRAKASATPKPMSSHNASNSSIIASNSHIMPKVTGISQALSSSIGLNSTKTQSLQTSSQRERTQSTASTLIIASSAHESMLYRNTTTA
ncbi:hypothetical protein BT63DRAFT_479886 [Microthyrium microscopicum]|uniref:Uncharacterized protein n=1 Tax=Microthyrium microscopicum TaxID=703497 RepID=A0A6A6UBJ4_9PEZI|nr:hypothetical protein BT63DRAFT_479886 [Microthyrium microscopicum]